MRVLTLPQDRVETGLLEDRPAPGGFTIG